MREESFGEKIGAMGFKPTEHFHSWGAPTPRKVKDCSWPAALTVFAGKEIAPGRAWNSKFVRVKTHVWDLGLRWSLRGALYLNRETMLDVSPRIKSWVKS